MAGPRRVVAFGGSAGALEPLLGILSKLPPDLGYAYLVAIHYPADRRSVLPALINRKTKLPAAHAEDSEPIAPDRVYIAPSDRHLIVNDGRLQLLTGPRENANRPSIDVLFRSVAQAARERAIAIVLSGTLDDGSAGLAAVARQGGTTIVQDPDDALFPDMPRNAIGKDKTTQILSAVDIARHLVRLGKEDAKDREEAVAVTRAINLDENRMPQDEPFTKPSPFVCPECSGTLWQLAEGSSERFRCRVGHAYSIESLLEQKSIDLEAALWAAVRALEEQADLNARIADRIASHGHSELADRFRMKRERAETLQRTVREAALRLQEANGAELASEAGEPGDAGSEDTA